MEKWKNGKLKIENSYESINIYRRYAINNTVKQVESSTRNSYLLMNWSATLKSTRIYLFICTQSCFISSHSYTIFLYTFALSWINLND